MERWMSSGATHSPLLTGNRNGTEGIYHAWNKGLKQAKGSWIGFLGADDKFATADVLAKMADAVSVCLRR